MSENDLNFPIPSVGPVTIAHDPYSLKFFPGLRKVTHIHFRNLLEVMRMVSRPRARTRRRIILSGPAWFRNTTNGFDASNSISIPQVYALR
jgi:hypothetical protein